MGLGVLCCDVLQKHGGLRKRPCSDRVSSGSILKDRKIVGIERELDAANVTSRAKVRLNIWRYHLNMYTYKLYALIRPFDNGTFRLQNTVLLYMEKIRIRCQIISVKFDV